MFGFEKFREGQYEVIKNIMNHQSTIFVSETASGKSLTYIIGSIIMAKQFEGMSIVISPLIALMLDQLDHLPYDLPAACISSLINYEQRQHILNLIKEKKVKLLFITPEMLLTDILFHLKQFPPINFVCID
jgi:superfamily II DNA helicase RecQ